MHMERITATAIALVLAATPVLAQDTAPADEGMMAEADWDQLIRTRDMTGDPVYTTNEAWDEGTWGGDAGTWGWGGYTAVGAGWNNIGEIEDVVVTRSGELAGVVVEVGGFLDMGDKHVMLRVEDLELVPLGDDSYSLITRYNEEDLEAMPGVDEGWWE